LKEVMRDDGEARCSYGRLLHPDRRRLRLPAPGALGEVVAMTEPLSHPDEISAELVTLTHVREI